MLKSTETSWGLVARLLHWGMALLIAAQAAIGWIADELDRTPLRADVMTAHKSLGITLLMLLALRLAWRAFDPKPLPPPGAPAWAVRAARYTHGLLYLLLFALLMSGWLAASTTILPWKLWWVLPWPAIAAPNPDLHHLAEEIHEASLAGLMALLAAHAGAALKHHFVDRDGVLRRMWRGR